MLLSKIKNIFSSFSPFRGKKRCGNSYLTSQMNSASLPGHSRYHSGQYTQRKNRLARFRQLLTAEKRARQNGYQGTVQGKKINFKIAGLAMVTVSLLIFFLAGGGQMIVSEIRSLPFFDVSEILTFGNTTISKEQLKQASGIIEHQTSLIDLDCAQVAAAISTIPWVAQAKVKRNWPSTIEISIVENVPVALLHSKKPSGSQLQYIDREGMPFLQVKPGADIDFPVITGLSEINEPTVRKRALAEALVFLENVKRNNPYLPAQSVSEIHFDLDGEMVVHLVEYPFPIFFGESDDTSKKYNRLVQVLKALYKKQNGKGSISQIEYIQMDYLNDKVLVAQSESG